MNPLLIDRIAHEQAIVPNYRALVDVWRSLAMRHPLRMLAAHATRVRLFLPPFATGMPDLPTFLHSTIEPNDFGLAWQWPALAGTARLAIRAWNAAGVVLANSALWLIVLIVTAWRRAAWRQLLIPTIIVGAVLNLGLIAAAPISEGRYGIFILICAQATLLYTCCEKMAGTPARPEAGSTRKT
jgi:hypothetical protein